MKQQVFATVCLVLAMSCNALIGQDDVENVDPEFLKNLLELVPEQPTDSTPQQSIGVIGAFAKIDSRLVDASDMLRRGETGESVQQAQQDVLNMMFALLDPPSDTGSSSEDVGQQEQQEQASSMRKTSADNAPKSEDSQAEQGSGASPGQSVENSENIQVLAGPMRIVDDKVWGHLPQRERGVLRASTPEKFLPRYREAISKYYQLLSTDDEKP